MQQNQGEAWTYKTAVAAALKGDQEAYRFLYESVYREKYYMALQYMKNRADAEDVMQEASVRAWKNLADLKDPEKYPSWFSMIVANSALNALKKKQPLLFSELDAENEDGDAYAWDQEDFRKEYQPEHAYTEKERRGILHEMIDSLSDEQRMCVLMYYIEEQPVKEIAGAAGCSENTIMSRLNYGRKNLAKKAKELENKGYRLYGLSGAALLRYLLRFAGIPEETAVAADAAMRASSKRVLEEAVILAGKAAAGTVTAGAVSAEAATSGLALKVAAALIGVAVLGGGAYGVLRGGGMTQNAPPVTGSSDTQDASDTEDSSGSQGVGGDSSDEQNAGDAGSSDFAIPENGLTDEDTARAAWQDLPGETQAEFERLLSAVGDNSDVLWVYMDDDRYPEMIVIDRDAYAEEGIWLCRVFYGNTAGVLQGKNYTNGVVADYVPATANEYENTARNVQSYYFVPGKGILINDEIVADEEMRLVAVMNEDKVVELKYVIGRRTYTVDESGDTPERVDLPAGTYEHYIIEFHESEKIEETQSVRDLSEAEYEELYNVGHTTELFSYEPSFQPGGDLP